MKPLRCSFCGLVLDRELAVCGPTSVICSDCIENCADILADGPVGRWKREMGAAEYESWARK